MTDAYKSYKGVVTPMASPLNEQGDIDPASAGKLITFLHDHGSIPFIMGTTGEATSLSLKNREMFARVLADHRREGLPLIAGVIGLPFAETVQQANKYFRMGLDAVVLTLPNYYELNDNQIWSYFKTAADRIDGNVILYNIPKTVHMSLPVDVADALSQLPNIIGIKDSEFDESRLERSLSLWRDRRDFFHLTGVNKLMVKGLKLGSRGIVPSTANFAPGTYRDLYERCVEKRFEEALELLDHTQELCDIYQQDISLADSLAALKVVLSYMGLCTTEVLPPLLKASEVRANEIINKYNKTVEV